MIVDQHRQSAAGRQLPVGRRVDADGDYAVAGGHPGVTHAGKRDGGKQPGGEDLALEPEVGDVFPCHLVERVA